MDIHKKVSFSIDPEKRLEFFNESKKHTAEMALERANKHNRKYLFKFQFNKMNNI